MREKILIVEDDNALRRSEALALKHFGFEVFEAPDGSVALEIFQQNEIQAVVMDGKMPIMDGFETCRNIRSLPNGKTIPILMVTGMNETQAIEAAYGAGATDFILKPVNLNVLSHRLKHLIENLRLQSDLTSTKSTLETFFAAIPSAVFFCNKSWQIIDANPAAESLFGWQVDVLRDLPLKTLFADNTDLLEVTRGLENGDRTATTRDFRFNTANEKPFWGEIVGAEVSEGWVISIEDATERRRAREEQDRTAKLDLMGLLAGGIAHDFNNILTAVFSSISLAQMEVPEASKASKFLRDTQPALDQAKRLASQLLTFSKGGAPVRKLCDMDKILRQTVEFSLRGSPVAPSFDIAKDCYPANVDEGQIVQVISNLAVNAVQAMPRRGKLWVAMNNTQLEKNNAQRLTPGSYLKITVRDEGSGISRNLLEKIFDPYFTTKSSGSGLGLATVMSVVKRHNGTISVDSMPGEGTIFTILLPAEALRTRVEFLKNNPAKKTPNASAIKKVLLLEDQELIRTAVEALLERCGCQVAAFDDGARAVEAYKREQNFDLAILDMTLPGSMSGLETLKALQAIDPNVCAVVSTGYADDPVMAEPERYGFSGILPKPYTLQTLQELLKEIGARKTALA